MLPALLLSLVLGGQTGGQTGAQAQGVDIEVLSHICKFGVHTDGTRYRQTKHSHSLRQGRVQYFNQDISFSSKFQFRIKKQSSVWLLVLLVTYLNFTNSYILMSLSETNFVFERHVLSLVLTA